MRFGDLYKQAQEAGAITNLIPDGDFRLQCTNANAGQTAAKDDKIGLQFKVIGQEGGDPLPDDDSAKGASGWINLTFGEKAANISMRQLRDLGLTDEFLESSDSAEEVAEACKGIVIDASVGHRAWGAKGENVSNTLKVNEIVVEPVLPSHEDETGGDEEPF